MFSNSGSLSLGECRIIHYAPDGDITVRIVFPRNLPMMPPSLVKARPNFYRTYLLQMWYCADSLHTLSTILTNWWAKCAMMAKSPAHT